MRTISLWQPWATLVAIGAKRIETRSWSTGYRGPLAIHAAKTWNKELNALRLSDPFWQTLRDGGWERCHELPRGGIVGVVKLIDCRPTDQLVESLLTEGGDGDDRELAFGNFSSGRFGWLFEDSGRRLTRMLPWRGSQGFFEVPDNLILALIADREVDR